MIALFGIAFAVASVAACSTVGPLQTAAQVHEDNPK